LATLQDSAGYGLFGDLIELRNAMWTVCMNLMRQASVLTVLSISYRFKTWLNFTWIFKKLLELPINPPYLKGLHIWAPASKNHRSNSSSPSPASTSSSHGLRAKKVGLNSSKRTKTYCQDNSLLFAEKRQCGRSIRLGILADRHKQPILWFPCQVGDRRSCTDLPELKYVWVQIGKAF
jgi:hypothetical protein